MPSNVNQLQSNFSASSGVIKYFVNTYCILVIGNNYTESYLECNVSESLTYSVPKCLFFPPAVKLFLFFVLMKYKNMEKKKNKDLAW